MIDTAMILLFPFLDFIPFGLPRYWIHRDKLKIRYRYVVVLLTAVSCVNSAAFYLINQEGYEAAARWTTLMRYGFMLFNLMCSFLLIREQFQKLMFTYLLLMSWSFFVFGNANFIESRFFWDFSDRHPYLIYNTARVAILLITYPFISHFLGHTVREALNMEGSKMWT